jgi:dienelactone hydrolase
MRARTLIAALVVAGVVPVACGGDDPEMTESAPVEEDGSDELEATASPDVTVPPANGADEANEGDTVEPAPSADETTVAIESPSDVATPAAEPPATTAAPVTPTDYTGRGPYSVGHTTLALDDRTVEVFYPADAGAVVTATSYEGYSTDLAFPEAIRAVVPRPLVVQIDLDDVSADPAISPDGPFPVVVRSHGDVDSPLYHSRTSAHLASWGFVVALPEHVERGFGSYFLPGSVPDRPGYDSLDTVQTLDLLVSLNQDETSILHDGVDTGRVGLAGFSQGGRTVVRPELATLASAIVLYAPSPFDDDLDEGDVRVLAEAAQLPLVDEHLSRFEAPNVPTLIISGGDDVAVPEAWVHSIGAWIGAPAMAAEIVGGGHQLVRDVCLPIQAMGGMEQFGDQLAPLSSTDIALLENGCTPDSIDAVRGYEIVNHLTAAFLLDAMGLADAGQSLVADYLSERFPDDVRLVD